MVIVIANNEFRLHICNIAQDFLFLLFMVFARMYTVLNEEID